MKQYLEVMMRIRDNGHVKADRTGTGTRSLFGEQMRFNILRDGFPLLTTKKVHLRSVIYELLWFLKGSDNKTWLNEHGVTIWDEWADPDGYLGPIYGKQWRSWNLCDFNGGRADQIDTVIQTLRGNPDDRRMIVSAWNVGDIEEMRLPPCHLLFQFYTHELSLFERALWKAHRISHPDPRQEAAAVSSYPDYVEEAMLQLDSELIPRRGLSCQMYQRSCDWFLGVPFNIASYALLTMMVAQVTNMVPYEFIWTGGDCHLYLNHLDQASEQLKRKPKVLPWMCVNGTVRDIDKFEYEDFKLLNYDPAPHIAAPISV